MFRKVLLMMAGALAMILIACADGNNYREIKQEVWRETKYFVEIRVAVLDTVDPCIFIWAKEVSYDKGSNSLVVKHAFLSQNPDPDSAAIKLEEAKFSFPWSSKISITNLQAKVPSEAR